MSKKVDDKKVQEIVTDTWTKHKGDAQAAWSDLYERRNDPNDPDASTDVDLAAAEHYMLCRYWVGEGIYSATQMKMMTHVYHAAKKTLPESWMRHDPDRPATPPSAEALAWALKGITDGENDMKANKVTAPDVFKMPPAFNDATQSYRSGAETYGYSG